MCNEQPAASSPSPPGRAPVELRLLVWYEAGTNWRAPISGDGIAEREFASPFELARFVAWPLAPVPGGGTGPR